MDTIPFWAVPLEAWKIRTTTRVLTAGEDALYVVGYEELDGVGDLGQRCMSEQYEYGQSALTKLGTQ